MDSILELDSSEIRFIKDTLNQNRDLLNQKAVPLFEDCFNLLLTQSTKVESFNLLKEISSGGDTSGQLSDLLNSILSICSSIFKVNLKGNEEFIMVVNDMGLKGQAQELCKVFQAAYLKKIEQLQNVYEDEQASMTTQYSKKFPLNL